MTIWILFLALLQAALLLLGAIQLSNVFMRQEKTAWVLRAMTSLSVPVVLASYAARFDTQRLLCNVSDCLLLVFSVAIIRVWLVTREEARIAFEGEMAARASSLAAAAARKAEAIERIREATKALEERDAKAARNGTSPPVPSRNSSPSVLQGGKPPPPFSGRAGDIFRGGRPPS